jgi:dienelactone hydrolase
MTRIEHPFFFSLFLFLLLPKLTAATGDVKSVPDSLQLNSFYRKYCDAAGIPIISSEEVRDEALKRAARILPLMLAKRTDVKQAMIDRRCRVMIIGEHEEVCDLPEYAHICDTPEHVAYWNRRARGFGGAPEDAYSASCGEENLLCLYGDRYAGENILVHEFAHLIHTVGITTVSPGFDERLEVLRQRAIEKELWQSTYAISSKEEYFAETVQSFFNCNRFVEEPDGIHNTINNREKLRRYDPEMYQLLLEYFLETDLPLCEESVASLYSKADAFREKFTEGYYYAIEEIGPIDDNHSFWYSTRTPRGKEFFLIDAEKRTTTPAFDQQKLSEALSRFPDLKEIDPWQLPFRTIRFNKSVDTLSFRLNDFDYRVALGDFSSTRHRVTGQRNHYWGARQWEKEERKVTSPDGKKVAYISEGNLWVTDLATKESNRLSDDGSPYEYYSSNIYWSPDSKKIVCCRYRPGGDRKLLLVSSSPKDKLQPETITFDYPKPGDALPIRRPVLFIPEEGKQITFDIPNVAEQYDLGSIKWNEDSEFFTFHFNRRGHQHYLIYSADITGHFYPVVDEREDTFIYYNNLYSYWFKNNDELLWISERDGWRHLYLYDVPTGRVKRQVTKGEWVVKSVLKVDEEAATALIKACGRDQGEDPYLEKYYRVNLRNGDIHPLTPENAQHAVTFSPDFQYMVDSYSRVDLPPTIVVRSTRNGEVIYRPEKQPDILAALQTGWNMPEVFTEKGRDGITDIWGVIIRPSDFNSAKMYPIIEYIYAGPQDSYVPKAFSMVHRCSELAEMGFITVMIDGMGTANRSKAFHDVCWQNLKDAGFPDRIRWIKAAAEKYPQMDTTRVGIYGTSAGGQNAMGALLFHPDFYKVAVASSGCHDNRMDKMWWNEQWMGYPIGKQYEESSNVVNAHLLEGDLMLILGELDNNVDPSTTLQVVNELIKHDKEFELVMIPGAGHTDGGKYGERKRRDFFVRHLLQLEPPKWNMVGSQ